MTDCLKPWEEAYIYTLNDYQHLVGAAWNKRKSFLLTINKIRFDHSNQYGVQIYIQYKEMKKDRAQYHESESKWVTFDSITSKKFIQDRMIPLARLLALTGGWVKWPRDGYPPEVLEYAKLRAKAVLLNKQ